MPGRCLLVELNPQSGRRRREQISVLPGWLQRDHIGEHLIWFPWLLLHSNVRAGEVEVQAGRGRDRAEGVMDCQLDVMRFAPAGNFPGFRYAADQTEVDPGVVDPLLLDRLAKLQQGDALLDRPLAAIDMRLGDRLVLRPKPDQRGDSAATPPPKKPS